MGSDLLTHEPEDLGRVIDFVATATAEIDIFDPRLRITSERNLETFYAPFEHVNSAARVTIIGLTPGQTQARIALNETGLGLKGGLPWHAAIERAKYLASFGGPMRTNLTKMLDHIGLNKWLGIDTSLLLFTRDRSIAHHTSILRFPVFKDRENYSGQPAINRVAFLEEQVGRWFATELKLLSNSVFVPLGAQVQEVFARLALDQGIPSNRCLIGIPHPSGANAERIAYFLEKKSKSDLSRQTNGEALDLAREQLMLKVQTLPH